MAAVEIINAKFSAKAGDVKHLDEIYAFKGFLPYESWESCFKDGTPDNHTGDGDYALFRMNVALKITGRCAVSEAPTGADKAER